MMEIAQKADRHIVCRLVSEIDFYQAPMFLSIRIQAVQVMDALTVGQQTGRQA